MEHKRHGRRGLEWVDALPFLAGAIILVAVPLVFILSYASSRYAAAICGSPSAEVSSPAASATPTPTPEATQEPEEAVCRYEEVELTEEDAYILACLVYHEARGEPFEGQAAVVEVVFNRCLSDEFPDTVEEVVFQKYGDVWQFSPAPYLYTAEPSETQYNAVMYAYNAEEPIVPPETVFFSTSPYNEHVTAIIGNHYFCKIGG
ncbi:cell wall hydrolase [uncultured Oscillibacter sp.]|uniref:cell wall hydrolase n=1 Tax=uncultured Oscillibacter sp. TaxID=876091 RepID=UPI001372D3C2|nr:cell wall hydrolase [uncultured Oscillibacter sp.]